MNRNWLLASLFLMAACGPMSLDDLRAEGDCELTKMTEILKEVDTKEALIAKLPKIKKGFNRIAELVISVRSIQEKTADDMHPSAAADELFTELARLYEMPGCRDLIEVAQNDAIQTLQ
jgi:hypothetical protein